MIRRLWRKRVYRPEALGLLCRDLFDGRGPVTSNLNVSGAIKGSHPIYWGYLFGTYPNWAAKFFMDALLFEEAALRGGVECTRCW